MALVLSAAILCRKFWPTERELSRKVVHIGIGPIIPLAWWLKVPADLAIPAAVLVTVFVLINHRWGFIPAVEDIKRQSYGTVAYGLAITILLILFWPAQAAAVCAGVMVMAFGDGLAGLIGPKLRSPSWLVWGQRKSIAGTTAMTVMTGIVLIGLIILIDAPIHPIRILIVTSMAVSLEQLSRWGIDNLTVPISIGLLWSWMTNF